MQRSLLALGLSAALSSCAAGSAVRGGKHLPVQNVVLYRSGVGYFERSGEVDGAAVEFSVKQREVADEAAGRGAHQEERARGAAR